MLYHYTSINAFLSMINGFLSNKQINGGEHEDGDCFTFWASSIYTMNDSSEMVYGYNFLKNVIPAIEQHLGIDPKNGLLDVLEKVEIHGEPKLTVQRIIEKHFFNACKCPFVLSLSHNENNLMMWHRYGDAGQGVMLAFDDDIRKTKIQDRMYAGNVEYGGGLNDKILLDIFTKELQESIKRRESKDGIELINEGIVTLSVLYTIICPYIKCMDYADENEFRISFQDFDGGDVRFRERNGQIVPYLPIKIPIHFLKGVTLGPCTHMNNMKGLEHIKYACDLNDISLSQSRVPYRL